MFMMMLIPFSWLVCDLLSFFFFFFFFFLPNSSSSSICVEPLLPNFYGYIIELAKSYFCWPWPFVKIIRGQSFALGGRLKAEVSLKENSQTVFYANHSEAFPLLQFLFLRISDTANIMKTHLFKYIENFTTKTESFQINILLFFIFLLKTYIVGSR